MRQERDDDEMHKFSTKPGVGSLRQDLDDDQMPRYDPDAVPRDMDGNVLCDGAGIPYGPLPKRNPDHYLDLNQTPAEFLAKINAAALNAGTKPVLKIQDDPERNYGFPKMFAVTRK